jgi:hypothetical protein
MTRALPLALAAVALAATVAPAGGDVRLAAVLPFLLLAPGLALIPLVRLSERLAQFMLGVALSLTLDVLAGQVMLVLGWHPAAAVAALAVICLGGVALQRARALDGRREGA